MSESEIIEQTSNRYILRRRLGAGAMGTVYQAADRLTGQDVAFKLVQAKHTATKTIGGTASRLALAHEFQILATLRHPNVIGVLDYGFDSNRQPYFTMVYLDGARHIREAARGQALNFQVELLIQLLEALVYLHRRGVVHRDLKPENILVTQDGMLKVVDFGVALTHPEPNEEEIIGTLAYMAPEILQGQSPTASSDIYAVGIVAYEMLTGRNPFNLNDVHQLMSDIVRKEPDFTPLETAIVRLREVGTTPSTTPTQPIKSRAMEAYQTEMLDQARPTKPAPTPDSDLFYTVNLVGQPQNNSQPSQEPMPITPEAVKTKLFQLENTPLREVSGGISTAEFENAAHPLIPIIRKMLAKHPQNRYQSAQQVLFDLKRTMEKPLNRETTEIRESFLQAARFVGREIELSQLSCSIEAVTEGQGCFWLIGGESGVGKSRLVDETRILAMVKGLLTVRGQALHEGNMPYQLWREPLRRLLLNVQIGEADASILKQIVPDIGQLLGREIPAMPPLTGAAAQQRLLTAINHVFTAYFKSCDDPLLIVLEDLQWATAENLDVLENLLAFVERKPLVLIGLYRNDEAPSLPDRFPDASLLSLERLKVEHIAELSASILGDTGHIPRVVEMLQRETEGNVYFLIEIVRALAEEVGSLHDITTTTLPQQIFAGGIEQVVQRRLEYLPGTYRPLLEIAAVAGRYLDLNLLKALAQNVMLDDWLTVCANAAIIEVTDQRWRFVHDKLREHVLSHLSQTREIYLHRLVAETIEKVYADRLEAFYPALANHWHHGLNLDAERHYATLAGEQAVRISAFQEARAFFLRALELVDEHDPVGWRQRVDVDVHLGSVYEYLSDYDLAYYHLARALELARVLDEPQRIATALLHFGWINIRRGALEEAVYQGKEAIQIARQLENGPLMAEVLSLLGVVHVVKGMHAAARVFLEEGIKRARQHEQPMVLASTLNSYGAALEGLGNYREAYRYLVEARDLAEKIEHRILLANVMGNLGRLMYSRGAYDEAEVHFHSALELFSDLGNAYGEAMSYYYLGLIETSRSNYKSAGIYISQSLRISQRIGAKPVALIAMCGVANIYANIHQDKRAAELLGMIRTYEAEYDVRQESRVVLERLEEKFSPDMLYEALQRGSRLHFDTVVEQTVAELVRL